VIAGVGLMFRFLDIYCETQRPGNNDQSSSSTSNTSIRKQDVSKVTSISMTEDYVLPGQRLTLRHPKQKSLARKEKLTTTETTRILPKLIDLADLAPSRSHPPNLPLCSCWARDDTKPAEFPSMDDDSEDAEECCYRTVHRGHKMDHTMFHELFEPFADSVYNLYDPPKINDSSDFFSLRSSYYNRNVVVVRDYVDVVVTDFLNHRSDPNCHPNLSGLAKKGPKENISDQYFDWSSSMIHSAICEYLIDGEEEEALRVFMDLSIAFLYQKYFKFSAAVREKQDPAHPRVKFVCFEKLSDPLTQRETFHSVMDWLYPALPGGTVYDGAADPEPLEKEYNGGHATQNESELRGRLRDLVLELDQKFFGGVLLRESEATGCGTRSYTLEEMSR